MEICDTKFNFTSKQETLDQNIDLAKTIIRDELLDQNINFLKRLENKLNRKVN